MDFSFIFQQTAVSERVGSFPCVRVYWLGAGSAERTGSGSVFGDVVGRVEEFTD